MTLTSPARRLFADKLLKGRVLDYGCGRGKDCECYNIEGYDPYYQPKLPKGKFNTILCTYVICVVSPDQQNKILKHIHSLLEPDGSAYITVRNNITNTITRMGTHRRMVNLELPLVYENASFKTYLLVRKETQW